jgi:hypothetical protein
MTQEAVSDLGDDRVVPGLAGDLGTLNGTRGLFYDSADVEYVHSRDLAALLPLEEREGFLDLAGGDIKVGFIVQSPTLTVVHCKAGPNVRVLPHRHGVNQMTYVLKGSLFYGKQEAKPGKGYYSPNKKYTWTSGPEGAEFLEIADGLPQMPLKE